MKATRPTESSPHTGNDSHSSGLRQLVAMAALWLAIAVMSIGQVSAQTSSADFYANFDRVALRDQNGKPLVAAGLIGKTVLFNFVYTACSTTCPIQTRALVVMRDSLPAHVQARVRFVSVSIDPLQDTPATLKAYAKRLGADMPGWSFATGRPDDIERLATALSLFRPGDSSARPETHSTNLWLIDAKGQLRQRYGGSPPDGQRLARELQQIDALVPGRTTSP